MSGAYSRGQGLWHQCQHSRAVPCAVVWAERRAVGWVGEGWDEHTSQGSKRPTPNVSCWKKSSRGRCPFQFLLHESVKHPGCISAGEDGLFFGLFELFFRPAEQTAASAAAAMAQRIVDVLYEMLGRNPDAI